MKTSTTQFKVIVDFMERYGDLSKSQNGLEGRLESIKKWQMLTNSLNKDPTGDRRPIEKWKKVWSDFKNNTKRKRTKILKYAGLPEHLRPKLALNDLEKRVLNVVDQGAPMVDGKTGVGVEIQYMDSLPQAEGTAPTTMQFISTEQNSQTFHAETMSDGSNSDYFTSSDESSDRSSDESIETDERRMSSPRSRHVNNNRNVFQRSRKSKGSPAGPSDVDPFEASDNCWRKLFSELTSEHIRLRKRELRQQERWHALFERCVDCLEKFINK